jgi:hypothetical protein
MNPNYPYPKNEMEFYSRNYSVDQLIANYPFQHLMAYYCYGISVLSRIEEIIGNNLYDEVGANPDEVWNDKMHYVLRTAIVRNAIQKLDACQVLTTAKRVFVHHLN